MSTTTDDPIDLLSPELLADPYGGYARLREDAPLQVGSMLGAPPSWLVTRYDDVRTVLTDPRFFNNPASVPDGQDIRPVMMARMGLSEEEIAYFADNILQTDGAEHTRLRKLVSRAFTVRRVSELRPRVEQITASLLDRVAEAGRGGEPVELVETFCYPLPITVICELVGIDEAERPQWHEWGAVLATMDPERVITLIFTLVIAGHETTSHLLGNSVLDLLSHPDQLAVLRDDPDLWPRAVHELMRLRAPVQFGNARYPSEDVEIGGTTIRAGSSVIPLIMSANTDPREFGEPYELDVRRATGRGEGHLGFGQGVHYCLGAALARQEAEVALRALFERFGGLTLAVDPSEIPWAPRPGFSRVVELPVRTGGGPR